MKERKQHDIDHLLNEVIQEEISNSQSPLLSEEEAWKEIRGKLDRQSMKRNKLKYMAIASSVVILLTAAFFNPSQGDALYRITNLFSSSDNSSTQLAGRVSEQIDDPDAPPESELFVINEDSRIDAFDVSLEEAEKLTSFKIKEPTFIPEGFVLEYVTVLKSPNSLGDEANLMYFNENDQNLSIRQMIIRGDFAFGRIMDSTDSKEININGHRATLTIYEYDYKNITWITNTHYFNISGSGLIEDEIIRIAESL
ncbi:DUF4367 domain-containing protein [Anaerobacillus sp. MEB173]|uniref:DUF4367 domain-containing protein n=1 Tax=Anaerobacillus sp. MEB173 TaxID=3383345 RepID=UPI003F92C457